MSRDVRTRIVAEDKTGNAFDKVQRKLHKTAKAGNVASDGLRNFAGSIAVVQGPLGPVAGRITALGAVLGRINPVALGATLAFTGFGFILSKSIRVAADYEKQMLRIEALIKGTGGAAGLSAKEIDEFANSLGEATLTSAAAVRDASSALLSFKSISGEQFKETLRLGQDLAATMGTDIKGAVVQFAKALEDPAVGLSMLKRAGVSFTNQQKEQIITLAKSGRQFESQQMILDSVRGTVGGAGAGEAGGLTGAVDTLGERWDRLLIKVGTTPSVMTPVRQTVKLFSGEIGDAADNVGRYNGEIDEATVLSRNAAVIVAALADSYGTLFNVMFEGFVKLPGGIVNSLIAAVSLPVGEWKKQIEILKMPWKDLVDNVSEDINTDNLSKFLQKLALIQEAEEKAFEKRKKDREDRRKNLLGKGEGEGEGEGKGKDPDEVKKTEKLIASQLKRFKTLSDNAELVGLQDAERENALFEQKLQRIHDQGTAILESKGLTQEAERAFLDEHYLAIDDLTEIHDQKIIDFAVKRAEKLKGIADKEAEENIARAERVAQFKISLEDQVAGQVVGILRQLGSKNKAASVAAIVLEKALAIRKIAISVQTALAQHAVATAVAAKLAFASQIVPGLPWTLATAEVASEAVYATGAIEASAIKGIGLASAVLTAASGGLEIAGLGGGNAGLPSGTQGTASVNPVTGLPTQSQPTHIYQINIGTGLIPAQDVRDLIDLINEEQQNGAVIELQVA